MQSNILVSDRGSPQALLSDYGLTSIIFDPFSLTRASINWTAPELLSLEDDRRVPSSTSDIYALAMVVYEVCGLFTVAFVQNGFQISVLGVDRCSAVRKPAETGVGMPSRP